MIIIIINNYQRLFTIIIIVIAPFIEHLLHARPWAKLFTYTVSFNLHVRSLDVADMTRGLSNVPRSLK